MAYEMTNKRIDLPISCTANKKAFKSSVGFVIE